MLAAAQHAALDELRPAKRQRQHGLAAYVGPRGGHVLLGVRISVYWPDDNAFYKVDPFLPQQMPQSEGLSATFHDSLMAAAKWLPSQSPALPCQGDGRVHSQLVQKFLSMVCYTLVPIVNPAIESPRLRI